jgi:1-acyl-sn-glycerol-3-phosphate acyltransferase
LKTSNGKTSVPIVGENVPKKKTYFLPWIGKFIFAIFGWGFKNEFPNISKFVIIIGPHTSNWDFVFGIAAIFILGAKISWMGKQPLFRKPFGGIIRWLGGIPIDRSSSHGMVDTMINVYKSMDEFILAIAPEGTRKKVAKWKSGFYRIATGADVPILMACFDYKNKIISFGPLIYPSGNLNADIEDMKLVFENIRGKKSQQKKMHNR